MDTIEPAYIIYTDGGWCGVQTGMMKTSFQIVWISLCLMVQFRNQSGKNMKNH